MGGTKRTNHSVADYLDPDYGDYGEEYGEYYQEDEEEIAIRESKKQLKKDQKAKQKAKKADQRDGLVAELEKLFPEFTMEQIKGTLESYQLDMEETKKGLEFKKQQMIEKGKTNVKAEKKQKVAEMKAAEEKKAEELEEQKLFDKKLKSLTEERKEDMVDVATLNKNYPEVDYFQDKEAEQAVSQNNLNLVIIGHVDSGKSTLTGHLLYDLGHVSKQNLRKNEKKADENNKAGFHFAYIMDETDEERERGVTIEVTTRFFDTPNRNFAILDAPGHRDFVANMITGAAQANCAILCVDSMTTQFERGWVGYQGTTKEHASLARSLGVTQLIIAVNKLEKLEWSKDRFDYIVSELKPFLLKQGFKEADLTFIPISGLTGENLISKSQDEALTSWYGKDSPCLLDILDNLRLPMMNFKKPLRVSVMDYTPKSTGSLIGDCIQAKVEAGVIRAKDELLLMPHNVVVSIKGIEQKHIPRDLLTAGNICDIGLRLPSDFDINYLKKGNILCDIEHPIPYVKTFIVRVVIYDLPCAAITKGEQVVVHSYTSKVAAKITYLLATVDQNTGTVIKNRPKFLKKGQFADVRIKLEERQCLELFKNYKNLGRIAIRKQHHTIAAGTIIEFLN